MLNHSPWLEINRKNWIGPKEAFLKSEVAIIGGGISGIATLYYLLKQTDKKILLLEKNHIASGATGHNAGLAIAHIEKPVSELMNTLGEQKTKQIFKELDEGYDALHSIHLEIGLENNLLSFPYAANGFCSLDAFFSFLEDHLIRYEGNLQKEWRYLALETLKSSIPENLLPFIECVPHAVLLKNLKTTQADYVAVAIRVTPFKAKRTNSALFCYKLLDYLEKNFKGRFSIYEKTDIEKIHVHKNHCILEHKEGNIEAKETILCTNAYKHCAILGAVHAKPIPFLQEQITPRLGVLAAFAGSPTETYALGFLNQQNAFKDVPFWYFSNAPHSQHNNNHSSVLGGPEFDLHGPLSKELLEEHLQKSHQLLRDFLKITFKKAPADFPFFWHGQMGYTPNGLRIVQRDSNYSHLWYNIGCNGIGIIPAITAAQKIASFYQKKTK